MKRGSNRPDRNGTISVDVVGPFRMTGPMGENLTPRLEKSRGLIALLAMTGHRQRSRAALQDKLWSDRPPEHGANSLRQSLVDIRRSLGHYAGCLTTEGRLVSLSENEIDLDLDRFDPTTVARTDMPILLEGLEIRDPEFEGWIRDQRMAFEARIRDALKHAADPDRPPAIESIDGTAEKSPERPEDTPSAAAAAGSVTTARGKAKPWLRILPPQTTGSGPAAFYRQMLSAGIHQAMCELGTVEVVTEPRPVPGVEIQADMTVTSSGVLAVATVTEAHDGALLWSGSQILPANGETLCDDSTLLRLVNQIVDVAGYCIRRVVERDRDASEFVLAFDAVQKMFQLTRQDLADADRLLEDAIERGNNGVALAWKAYLRTFLVAEHGADVHVVGEEVRDQIRRAIEIAPFNSQVLALASYVHTFLLREHATGLELARRSLEMSPSNPLALAFHGVAEAFLGKHQEGYSRASMARDLAGPGPYRYTIDFLCSVTATLAGDYDNAIRMNEIVRALKPDYKPTYRYLTALYLQQGDREKALEAMTALRKSEPDFSIDRMLDPDYPSSALRAAGLLATKDPDFR